jgi:FkbM family methyltransferase
MIRYDKNYMPYFGHLIPRYVLYEIRPLFLNIALAEDSLTVFDIGAHKGIWSAALLHYGGPFVRELHLFEPMPGNLEHIGRHIQDGLYEPFTPKLTVNPVAVSDEPGELTLRYASQTSAFASAATNAAQFRDRDPIFLEHSKVVPATSIDEYLKERNIESVNLMKVDVEGYELPVLTGGEGAFQKGRIRRVIFEFGIHQMARKEYFKDFWTFLHDYGYEFYHLLTLGRVPQRIERYNVRFENFGQMTMFMAAKNRI